MHSHHHLREVHPGRKKAHERSHHFKRGGKVHGDEKEDRKLFGKMLKEHEDQESKPEGKKSGGRLDKYARGGKTKGHHKTNINIVVAPHGRHPADAGAPGLPGGAPPPVGAGPLPPPGGPLGAGPPGMPPGMPPGGPPGMPPMKRGGKVGKFARGGKLPAKLGMKAGADTGLGRLEKAHKYKARG